jgi:hypothetical protein
MGLTHCPQNCSFIPSLKSAGRLLMDLMTRDIFIRIMPSHAHIEQSDGSRILSEHHFTGNGN